MASVRFPNKILLNLHGLPMVEHVRRRALISKYLKEVYIATCDTLISNRLANYGVKTIKTSKAHKNGTTRVAEAVGNLNCTHVILLQGDEPLLLPNYIDLIYKKIFNEPKVNAWNLTAPILNPTQYKDKSIVKCRINKKNEIFELQRFYNIKKIKNIKSHRKILGIIAYRKDFLLKLVKQKESKNEIKNIIEQSRIIDNKFVLKSINVPKSLPSINLKKDKKIVTNYLNQNNNQKILLNKILSL